LVDGLNRSSGAARVLGLNLDQTIAILTVMREATGRTGKEVGNALNSILSFMQRNVALQAFAREGIAVWADEAQTQFRNVIDIFDEVAQRWPDMSAASQDMFVQAAEQAGLYSEELAELAGVQKEFNDLQQRDISQAMAGIYRRNYLLALLQNWAKIDEVLISMEDSLGYSMRENERTMQTLAKQYESLKAAAQELAVAIGDAGLMSQIKELTIGLRDLTTWFNELDPALRSLIINFAEVTIAVKLLGAAIKMAGIGGATNLLSGWAVSATAATAATRTLTGAVTGLMTVLLNVGRGIVAFLGGPWGLALTAATAAYMTFRSSADISSTAMEKNAEKALKTANEIQKLRDRYIELTEKTDLTSAEQEEFKNVTKRLLELVPSAITGFDDMGNAVTDVGTAAEASAGKIELLRKEHEKLLQAKASVAKEVLPGLREQLKQQEEDFSRLTENVSKGSELARVALSSVSGGLMEQWKIGFAKDAEIFEMAEDKLNAITGKMIELRTEIAEYEAAIKAASGIGTTPEGKPGEQREQTRSPGYVGGISGNTKKVSDAIKGQLNALTDVISQLERVDRQYEASLAKTGNLLSINASEYEYLTSKIEAGTVASEDYARGQELVAVKIALLQQEQEQLHLANEKYRRDINSLAPVLQEATRQYKAFRNAGDAEHIEDAAQVAAKLQDKIRDLSSALSQNSAQWWQNQRTIMETKRTLSEDYFSRLTSWMQHMASTGRLITEQQIEYYQAIDRTNLSLQSQRQIEKELYNLRGGFLQAQMDEIRDAYDERMRQIEDEIEAEEESTQRKIDSREKRIEIIDEETNAQIEAIEALINALDVEDKQSDREEAERKHNQKLADLRESLQYHELRTGLEHQRTIADINRQIAEEEHEWELKKQEWARQDQKDAYRDQIAALREQAEARKDAIKEEINDIKNASNAKKKKLQRYYDDVQRLMNDRTLDMLATLSLYGDKYVDKVEDILQRIKKAIEKNKLSLLPGLIGDLSGVIKESEEAREELLPAGRGKGETAPPTEPKIAKAVFPSSSYINKDGTTYAWSRMIADKLGLPVEWDEKNRMVKIGNRGFSPDFIKDDRAYLGLRRVGEAFGYDVRYDNTSKIVSYFPQAHTGAFVAEGGVAKLLKDERVLSPHLTVSFDRLANVLMDFPNIPDKISLMQQGYSNIDRAVDRIIAAIERRKGFQIGTLFNAENVELEDQTDMEILSRELARAVNTLQTARG